MNASGERGKVRGNGRWRTFSGVGERRVGGKREISLILSQGVEGWYRHKYPHRATGNTRSARPRLSFGAREVIVTIPWMGVRIGWLWGRERNCEKKINDIFPCRQVCTHFLFSSVKSAKLIWLVSWSCVAFSVCQAKFFKYTFNIWYFLYRAKGAHKLMELYL